MASAPIIDISKLTSDRDGVRKQVRDAAVEWGFFQVINHGISLQDLKELQAQGFQFFDLPDEVKLRAQEGDWKVFHLDNTKVHRSALERAQSLEFGLYNLNAIMLKVWPEGNAKFSDAVKEFSRASDVLQEQVLEMLAESFGLTTDFFSRHLNSRRTVMLRLNFYPPCTDASDVLGASSHTDGNCLTVLLQDDVGGLQIHKDGHWIDIPPIEGALVINVGDILHAWTNGTCKSVLHRVFVSKTVPRLSLAAFLGVDGEVIVSAPEELIDEEHPRLYRPFKAWDYISHVMALRGDERSSKELRNGHLILEDFKLQE